MSEPVIEKTMIRRQAQHRDRWTTFGAQSGLDWISDRLTPNDLREIEIFADYDDDFLERISPDVSVGLWKEGVVLFEEGSYLDLAFFIADGRVAISLLAGTAAQRDAAAPIFEAREAAAQGDDDSSASADAALDKTTVLDAAALASLARRRPRSAEGRAEGVPHQIPLLASMDQDLAPGTMTTLEAGDIFGEIGALSGWPQSVTARTATRCRLVQIRVPALRLMRNRSSSLKQRLDRVYRERSLLSQLERTPLLAGLDTQALAQLREEVALVSCSPGEAVVREGERCNALYLVRSGFLALRERLGDGELTLTYLSKGMTMGEVELLVEGGGPWHATAQSVEYAELVEIPGAALKRLCAESPELEQRLWESATARIREMNFTRRHVVRSEFVETALEKGLVEGSSILLIDLESCTRCDDCVRACEATHGGRARFVREGDKLGNLLVAKSCYHCRDPVCLVGCPTGAIHRAGIREVVAIHDEICIGCGTCADNCPYDAIVMHETGEQWPGDMVPTRLRGQERLLASKCDQCYDTGHGPACVSSCPQSCAFRVGSVEEIERLLEREDG